MDVCGRLAGLYRSNGPDRCQQGIDSRLAGKSGARAWCLGSRVVGTRLERSASAVGRDFDGTYRTIRPSGKTGGAPAGR